MQDVVLCGGAQEINWPSMASFDALGAFARFNGGDPAASLPALRRQPQLAGASGGAAMLVIERLDHAVVAGCPISER